MGVLQEIELENEKRAASDALKVHVYNEIKEHEESFHSDNIRDFIDLYIKTSRTDKGSSQDGFNRMFVKYLLLSAKQRKDSHCFVLFFKYKCTCVGLKSVKIAYEWQLNAIIKDRFTVAQARLESTSVTDSPVTCSNVCACNLSTMRLLHT